MQSFPETFAQKIAESRYQPFGGLTAKRAVFFSQSAQRFFKDTEDFKAAKNTKLLHKPMGHI